MLGMGTLNRLSAPFRSLFLHVLCASVADPASLRAEVQEVTHRVTGLFAPEREADLREAAKAMPGVALVRVDFERGEAVFAYDPAVVLKGTKPQDRVRRFDQLLRKASSNTFGARPPLPVPWGTLVKVEIPVAGLDCPGCDLAAYESIAKIDGVERATASFREGKVTARIDPERTSREALIEALKKRRVSTR